MTQATESGASIQYGVIQTRDTYRIRHEVLWPNLSLAEQGLDTDSSSVHFGAFATHVGPAEAIQGPNEIVGIISICPAMPFPASPLPHPFGEVRTPPPERQARFRKFACLEAWQGKGIGTQLMATAMQSTDCDFAWLEARASARGWYERRGWKAMGEATLRGGASYIKMGYWKEASPS